MPAPVFNFNGSKRPTEFGRISVPDDDWLALQAGEALLPELPIIDPHHHLWEYPGYRYPTPEFSQDIGSGHHVVATVYAECVSMYRENGPESIKPLGEIEFAVGEHAKSASGEFGADRCMFESNFPLERMGTSYFVLWNCFRRIAAHASDSEKQALFAGTADRVYRMGRGYAVA